MPVMGTLSGFKRSGLLVVLLLTLVSLCAPAAQAQTRLIVRDSLGLPGLNLTCLLLGCNVVRGLGDPQGQLFLITFPPFLDPVTAVLQLKLDLGIVDVEFDQTVDTRDTAYASSTAYLSDETPTLLRCNRVAWLLGAARESIDSNRQHPVCLSRYRFRSDRSRH